MNTLHNETGIKRSSISPSVICKVFITKAQSMTVCQPVWQQTHNTNTPSTKWVITCTKEPNMTILVLNNMSDILIIIRRCYYNMLRSVQVSNGERHQRGVWAVRCPFEDGALLSHHSIRVHVCDVDGEVPPSAGHAARHRHAQGVVRLLSQCDRLLIAGRLLTRVLHRGQRQRERRWRVN